MTSSATMVRAPVSRALFRNEREEIVALIAEHYRELVSPNGPNGLPGSGERSVQMPETYTRSVREFERLMEELRRGGPVIRLDARVFTRRELWWNVRAWYVEAEPVIKRACQVVSKQGNRYPLLERGWPARPKGHRIVRNADGSPAMVAVRCYRRRPGADREKAMAGIRWIAREFRFVPVDPFAEADKRRAAA